MNGLFNFELNIFLLKKVWRRLEKVSLIHCIKKAIFLVVIDIHVFVILNKVKKKKKRKIDCHLYVL